MGLLDQILGSVLNNNNSSGAAPQRRQQQPGLGGLAGGGALGGLIGLIASNPQLLQMLLGMLSNRGGGMRGSNAMASSGLGGLGALGGLGGLMAGFEQAGLGSAMQSWIGSGPNQEVSGQEISQALGNDTLESMAAQLGMPAGDVADQLSQLLPGVVNELTPDGQMPPDGFGSSDDMLARLGAALGPR